MNAIAVATSTFGQVLYCPGCRVFHIEFGNLHLSMYIERVVDLWESLQTMNPAYYEEANRANLYRRKIMIPISDTTLNMLFSAEELHDLRDLLERAIDRAVLPEEARHAATRSPTPTPSACP